MEPELAIVLSHLPDELAGGFFRRGQRPQPACLAGESALPLASYLFLKRPPSARLTGESAPWLEWQGVFSGEKKRPQPARLAGESALWLESLAKRLLDLTLKFPELILMSSSPSSRYAYQLRFSWTGWPSGDARFPDALSSEARADLEQAWETDGFRALEWEWRSERIRILFSTRPEVSPVVLCQRAKGRLQHRLRQQGDPVTFSRKVSCASWEIRRSNRWTLICATSCMAVIFPPKYREALGPVSPIRSAGEIGFGRTQETFSGRLSILAMPEMDGRPDTHAEQHDNVYFLRRRALAKATGGYRIGRRDDAGSSACGQTRYKEDCRRRRWRIR